MPLILQCSQSLLSLYYLGLQKLYHIKFMKASRVSWQDYPCGPDIHMESGLYLAKIGLGRPKLAAKGGLPTPPPTKKGLYVVL